jgi:tetratricopeptide (TPR) repeat protein
LTTETPHTLRIRCPTWDHLENFYERKIKDGNILLARVPFSPAQGSELVLALELPDRRVVDIRALVEGVRSAPDGRKSAIRMLLMGMSEEVLVGLQTAVLHGRQGATRSRPLSDSPPVVPRTQTGLPVPIPADVPIDELVPVVVLPEASAVPEPHRQRYAALDSSLRALREKAAHDVLGVAWDAEVADIRVAYFKLVKQYHPDVVARHDSPEISLLASEIFIYINKAYDRLRDSAVAAGKAFAAGPALLPHKGWIADFDDIGTVKPRRPLRSDDMSATTSAPGESLRAPGAAADISVRFAAPAPSESETAPVASAPVASASPDLPRAISDTDLFSDARSTQQGMAPLEGELDEHSPEQRAERLTAKGEAALEERDYEAARNDFAEALELQPRSRVARALYHVAYGQTLLAREKGVEAMTQFEVALKHDPDCGYARNAKSAAGTTTREPRPSLFKRLFGR